MAIDCIQAHNRKICYQSKGDPSRPCVLMVNGVSSQLTDWPDTWTDAFVHAGFRIITFDNRDVGQSTWYDHLKTPSIATALLMKNTHIPYKPPYTFDDMADDIRVLLEALAIPKAHLIGISMGGMVAQHFALHHPEKLQSLALLCSTSNDPKLSRPHPEVLSFFSSINLKKPCKQTAIQKHMRQYKIYQPNETYDADTLKARFEKAYARAYHPHGVTRQILATLFTPAWHHKLHQIQTRTLIVHGEVDPVFPIDHAEDLALHIPHSQKTIIPRMGHGVAVSAMQQVMQRLHAHLDAAESTGTTCQAQRIR